MNNRPLIHCLLLFALVLTLSCSAPLLLSAPPSLEPAANTVPPPPAQSNPIPAVAGSGTPPPLVATIMASQHIATPANVAASGKLNYDVDSSGTGPEHRAPYGDSYKINLFERPFTQTDMDYLPQLDIATFQLHEDANWYYVSFDLVGGDMNDASAINYGVELDTDHDGFGDVLIWAYPPYTPEWLAETVQVYRDTNHDTGGASAEQSDAVYPGNGYDSLIFDRGQGSDIDLAWVRLNPQVTAAVQFAFKRSLAGNAFMWGVWADSGLRDPSQFNYNDRFTEEQAGSPEKSEKHYPIQAVYQVDNTCWATLGFNPTGYEPHLCPSLEPQPTRHKAAPTPPSPTCQGLSCYDWGLFYELDHLPPEVVPALCMPAGTLADTPQGPIAIEDLRPGDGVWSASETGARFSAIVTQVSRRAVPSGHAMVRVLLADGRELRASPGHPTADGRAFGDIQAGDMLDGALVSSAEVSLSQETVTYDFLPSGTTGFYWANGVLVGSTLAHR